MRKARFLQFNKIQQITLIMLLYDISRKLPLIITRKKVSLSLSLSSFLCLFACVYICVSVRLFVCVCVIHSANIQAACTN